MYIYMWKFYFRERYWNYNVHAYLLTVFLISLYDAPLAQRASYLALHSSLFGPDGAVNYDYIVTNSINSQLIGLRCIPNGTHTDHCWANLAHASKLIKNSASWPIYIVQHKVWLTEFPFHNQKSCMNSLLDIYHKLHKKPWSWSLPSTRWSWTTSLCWKQNQ